MSDEPKQDIPETDSLSQIILRRIGLVILAAGLAVSAVIFATVPAEDKDAADDNSGVYVAGVDNSKRYQLELERIGGKSAIVAAEINDWLESLWHGRRLAGTLAVLSVGISLLCFGAARIHPLDDGKRDE